MHTFHTFFRIFYEFDPLYILNLLVRLKKTHNYVSKCTNVTALLA